MAVGPAFTTAPPPVLSNDELLRRASRRSALRRGEFEGGAATPSAQDIADAEPDLMTSWLHAGLLTGYGTPPRARRRGNAA